MKTKIFSTVSLVTVISLAAFSVASAQGLRLGGTGNVNVDVNTEANIGVGAQTRGNDTSASSTNKVEVSSDEKATSSTNHRSVVATFVRSLLDVADREDGIGAEVRAVAHSQNDSATTTAFAMAKVDDRGSVKTFFLGSDYRDLGIIRSELATTSNNIARLKAVLNDTTNVSDRAELSAQIQVLENQQVKINAYVNAHENTFSLFGWFMRMFQ